MRFASIPALVLAALALPLPAAHSAPLNRPDDPVVVTGAGTPGLVGAAPGDVVAFAWSGSWQQIPVQVDERKLFDLRAAYPTPFDCAGNTLCYVPFSTPAKLRYADPSTLVGADTDPALDANDEIAFMAKDTAAAAGAAPDPAGTVAGSRVEVKVSDSLDGGVGHAYLFRQDGTLDPSAGRQYVSYSFSLTSGAYPGTYRFAAGTNPESSTVVTPYYSLGFIDRWRESQLRVLRGAATGADILDRTESQFSPDYCGRSTLTFAGGEGAFLANRSGPGARDPRLSGGEQRSDDRAAAGLLRGPRGRHDLPPGARHPRRHELPGLQRGSHRDDLPEQQQPRRRDDRRPGRRREPGHAHLGERGRPAGRPDERPSWSTTVAASKFTSFYRDLASPPAGQTPCQGDAGFYGASGPYINGTINDTNEPANGSAPAERLSGTRTIFFDAPGSRTGRCAASRSAPASPPTSTRRPPRRPPPSRLRPARPHRMRAPPRRPRRRSSCPSRSAIAGGTEAVDATGPFSPSAAPG